MKKILITGMSGLIGGILREHLDAVGGYELTALNRRPVEGVPCLQADIADLEAIRPAFDGIDVVVHLAAHTGEGRERQYARAARLADGMISISDSPEEFAKVRGRVVEEARALGRDEAGVRAVYYMTVNLGRDVEAARAEAVGWVQRYYGLNFWGDRWGPYGPPEALVERVREYAAAGADEVIIRFASPDPAGQMDIFEREVLPALR